MVRSAAKNWAHVGIVVDPDDYSRLLDELQANDGSLPEATRFALAQKAFAHTSAYDGAIANWLTARGPDGIEHGLPTSFRYAGELVQPLRYGENPHQQAAFYRDEVAAAKARSRRTGRSRARSSRTTTSPIAMRRGNA